MRPPLALSALPAPVRTPLLRSEGPRVKAEGRQLAGSVKYRMLYAKLEAAFRRGDIPAGTTLTELSSGSTGAALAWAGQRLGLPVEIHAYPSIRVEKRAAIERAGAKLVLHEPDRPVPEILSGLAARAREGGTWHLDQYDRDSVAAAYADLAAELLRQLETPPSVFICPVGTGGLIQGVGGRLREARPGIRVLAVEPLDDARIDGIRNTERSHMGKLDPYDRAFPDEVARVEPPGRRVSLGGALLGESASAAFLLARARGYADAVMIAPD